MGFFLFLFRFLHPLGTNWAAPSLPYLTNYSNELRGDLATAFEVTRFSEYTLKFLFVHCLFLVCSVFIWGGLTAAGGEGWSSMTVLECVNWLTTTKTQAKQNKKEEEEKYPNPSNPLSAQKCKPLGCSCWSILRLQAEEDSQGQTQLGGLKAVTEEMGRWRQVLLEKAERQPRGGAQREGRCPPLLGV